MANTTIPFATCTINNAHADGQIVKHAWAADYQFPSPDPTRGGAEESWSLHSGTEYLPELRCVRPRGYVPVGAATVMRTWSKEHGTYWRNTIPTLFPQRCEFAEWFDTRADQWGQLCSTEPYYPNVCLTLVRFAQPEQTPSTTPAYVSLVFIGDGAEGHDQMAFVFPIADEAYAYPYLTINEHDYQGEAGTPVSYWEGGAASVRQFGDLAVEQIWFENVGDYWHIRRTGVDTAWVYMPGKAAFSVGPVRLRVSGHACMAHVAELNYGAPVTCRPFAYRSVQSDVFSTTRVWHAHGENALLDTAFGNGSVAVTEQANPLNADQFRPVLTFDRVDRSYGLQRAPASWVVTGYAAATQGNASSSPLVLSRANGYPVERLGYTINYEGRGQTCSLVVQDPNGTAPWKGNNKLTVSLGYHTSDGSAPTTAQKFLGYLVGYPRTRDFAARGQATMLELEFADPIGRLERKYMVNRSAAQLDTLYAWAGDVLYDSEVPASQLTALVAVEGTANDPVIPWGNPPGDLRFRFGSDVCVIDALDQVTASMGYEWGFCIETGLYFLQLPTVYSGSPDYTLDDDAAARADAVWNLTHESSPQEFRNYLLIMSELGGQEWSVVWRDTNSHFTSGAANFIGQSWWDVLVETDTPQAGAAAWKRWSELIKRRSLVSWTMDGGALWPGDYVRMQVARQGIATNSVYQVIEERGEVTGGEDDLEWRSTYTARFIQ